MPTEEARAGAQDEEAQTARVLARERAVQMVDKFLKCDANDRGFEINSLEGVCNLQSDGPGHCTAELPVQRRHTNWLGTLHGGCTGAAHAFNVKNAMRQLRCQVFGFSGCASRLCPAVFAAI